MASFFGLFRWLAKRELNLGLLSFFVYKLALIAVHCTDLVKSVDESFRLCQQFLPFERAIKSELELKLFDWIIRSLSLYSN